MGLKIISLTDNYYMLFCEGSDTFSGMTQEMERVSYYIGYTDYKIFTINHRYGFVSDELKPLIDYVSAYDFWLPSVLYILKVVSTFEFEMKLTSHQNSGSLKDVILIGQK
jgi:hypothetical protein